MEQKDEALDDFQQFNIKNFQSYLREKSGKTSGVVTTQQPRMTGKGHA